MDGHKLDDRSEGHAKVDAGPLIEATHYLACLVVFKAAVGVILVLKHPLAGDDVGTDRPRNQSPGMICLECVELMLHCGLLVRITKCRPRQAWNQRDIGRGWGYHHHSILGLGLTTPTRACVTIGCRACATGGAVGVTGGVAVDIDSGAVVLADAVVVVDGVALAPYGVVDGGVNMTVVLRRMAWCRI